MRSSRAALLALGAFVFVSFAVLSASGPGAPLVFGVAVLVLAYAPGRLILDVLRLEAPPVARAVVSLSLGLASSTAAYWVLASVGARRAFWAWPACSLLALAARRSRGAWTSRRPRTPTDEREIAALVVPLAVAVATLFLSPFYYRNLVRTENGGLTFHLMPDTVWHLSFAQELGHTVPPTAPFMPGRRVNYHYGPDTATAAFAQAPLLEVEDVAARFLPTVFFGIALGAAFSLARALRLPCGAAAACAFLVVFGEDFSFIPALLRGAPEGWPWAATILQAPTVVSLFMMNPMLPALGLLLTSLYALARFSEDRQRGWGIVVALLAGALFHVKVFAAAQLGLALGLAASFCLWRFRDARLAWLTAATGVLLLPGLGTLLVGGLSQPRVAFHPSAYVPAAVVNLGLAGTVLGSGVDALVRDGRVTPGSVAAFAGATAVYLFFAMGLRGYGVGRWIRSFSPASPGEAHRLVLALLVLLGPLLTLNLEVLPEGHDPAGHYNNAIWFLVVSKYVAWFFAVEALLPVWLRAAPRGRALLGIAVLALSLPSTVQFLAQQAAETPPPRLNPMVLDVADYLRAHAAPGSVVVAPQALAAPLVSLAPCRATVPAAFGYLAADSAEIDRRTALLQAFWRAWSAGGPVAEQLRGLAPVDYVVAPRPAQGLPSDAPLEAVFRTGSLVVYRVTRAPS